MADHLVERSGTRYRTIVADPPWRYSDKFASFTHGGTGPEKINGLPYPSLTVEEICALPVAEWANTDCRLWLWATNRYLRTAFDVIDAWRFQYVQGLVWHKTGNPSPLGGSVCPQHHEYLLVANRGAPKLLSRLDASVIQAPAAVFGHSAKPECFLDYIEAVSPEPRLELFARRARLVGWDYWGDESLGTAELSGEAVWTPLAPSVQGTGCG